MSRVDPQTVVVSGVVTIRLELDQFEVSRQEWDSIRRDIGWSTPARVLSELFCRRSQMNVKQGCTVADVNAVPRSITEK